MRDTEREAETQAEGEAGSLGGPHVRFNPRTPGSRPEPKADAEPLSHPGAPEYFLQQYLFSSSPHRNLVVLTPHFLWDILDIKF